MFHPVNNYLLVEKIDDEEEKKAKSELAEALKQYNVTTMPISLKAYSTVKIVDGYGEYYVGKRAIVQSQGLEKITVDNKDLFFIPRSYVIAVEEND